MCISPRCDSNEPFMCPDRTCQDVIAKCKYPYNIKLIKHATIETENNLHIIYLNDQTDRRAGTLFTSKSIEIRYKGVSINNMSKTRLIVDQNYDPVYLVHFAKKSRNVEPREFIRSAIVNIEFDQKTKYQMGTSPLKLHLNGDLLITNTFYDSYKLQVNS